MFYFEFKLFCVNPAQDFFVKYRKQLSGKHLSANDTFVKTFRNFKFVDLQAELMNG